MASSPSDAYDFLFKIIIIGDSGVGKSAILNRYTHNEFRADGKTTIGVELATSVLKIDEKIIKIAVWDTAGQERFRAASNLYYRNTMGAFIVYDITNTQSFVNVKRWLNELKQNVTNNITVTLVGNKSDLAHLRAITPEEGQQLADKHNMKFIETSALDSSNVEVAFTSLVEEIYQDVTKTKVDPKKKTFRLRLIDNDDEGEKKPCCPVI